MKKANQISVVLLGMFISLGAQAQREVGNGGFAFTNAIETLKFAQTDIVDSLAEMDHHCINESLISNNLKPVDLDRLSQIIKSTRRNYTKIATAKDENGEDLPLMFDYGKDQNGPYIEALLLYFVSFMNDHNSIRYEEVETLLLHEAAHHFGFREKEAAKFAQIILQLRNNTTGDKQGDCWK